MWDLFLLNGENSKIKKVIKFLDRCNDILLEWAKRKDILSPELKIDLFSFYHDYFNCYAKFIQEVTKALKIQDDDIGNLDYCVKEYIIMLSGDDLKKILQTRPKNDMSVGSFLYKNETLETAMDILIEGKDYDKHLHTFIHMLQIKKELYLALFQNDKASLKRLLSKRG